MRTALRMLSSIQCEVAAQISIADCMSEAAYGSASQISLRSSGPRLLSNLGTLQVIQKAITPFEVQFDSAHHVTEPYQIDSIPIESDRGSVGFHRVPEIKRPLVDLRELANAFRHDIVCALISFIGARQ